MQQLLGEPVAQAVESALVARVAALAERGVTPKLVLCSVGEDPASRVYLRRKEEAAARLGIAVEQRRWAGSDSPEGVRRALAEAGRDSGVHGVLLQLPLPEGWDAPSLQESLPPAKDVDGLHPENAGRLAQGLAGLVPCTPLGVLALLRHYEIPLAGRHVVIMGRSAIVGRPLSLLLSGREVDATVTVVHSRTRDAAAICRTGEILVAAIGRPRFVTAEFVRPGATVVDVGIHSVESPGDGGKRRLVGDVDTASVAKTAGALSPVPGGVGPLTVAFLLSNTVLAAERLSGAAAAATGRVR